MHKAKDDKNAVYLLAYPRGNGATMPRRVPFDPMLTIKPTTTNLAGKHVMLVVPADPQKYWQLFMDAATDVNCKPGACAVITLSWFQKVTIVGGNTDILIIYVPKNYAHREELFGKIARFSEQSPDAAILIYLEDKTESLDYIERRKDRTVVIAAKNNCVFDLVKTANFVAQMWCGRSDGQ